MLTVGDRVEIASGLKVGWSIRAIAEHIGRCPSVVSREVRSNATKTRGYKIVTADCRAQRRRARPQQGKVAGDAVPRTRVAADLARSRTPRQIAGRLHAEARSGLPGCVAGAATRSGGCRSTRRETARNATMAPGRYATRMTITQARTAPVTGARPLTHPAEIHADSPTHTAVQAIATVNLAATER